MKKWGPNHLGVRTRPMVVLTHTLGYQIPQSLQEYKGLFGEQSHQRCFSDQECKKKTKYRLSEGVRPIIIWIQAQESEIQKCFSKGI
ncbi:hypothetical protein FGO68_gene6904 [Halteria grandinella]|uniref:Uncharacterized protein n=1 Tax=Halteria grandinella TaxID=5974 RepID=A0A8J8NAR5_HALGN|nr:hypothetical protein FGO68_gene6904 [Halteria grandinella]